MEITMDKTWVKALQIFKDYEIDSVNLEKEDEEKILLENMDDSHTAQIKAKLLPEEVVELNMDIALQVYKLHRALKSYGEYPVDVVIEEGKMTLKGDQRRINLATLTSEEKNSPNPELELNTEVEGVNLSKELKEIKKVFKPEDFNPHIYSENGNLYIEYENPDYTDKYRNRIGEVGEKVDSRYSYDLLKPIKGEWNLKLGEQMPLVARKEIKNTWNGEFEVLVAPRIDTE